MSSKKLKFIKTISILLLGQALMYIIIKKFQYNYHTILLPLDNKIPFIPSFIYIYNLFYPVVFISFLYLFIKDEKTYLKNITAGVIGYLICDIIYVIYPTIMVRPNITNLSSITNKLLELTYKLDTPALNCFPSIHCLFCFQVIFSYILTNKISKKIKYLTIIPCILIILSTLIVKQHYILDIPSSFIISVISTLFIYKYSNKKGDLYERKH